jgi:hypothetical protein
MVRFHTERLIPGHLHRSWSPRGVLMKGDCIKNVVLLRGYKEASFCQAGWQKHRRFSGSVVGSSDKGEGRGKNATRTHREYCRAF